MRIVTRAGAASIFVVLCVGVLGTIAIFGAATDANASGVELDCFGCYDMLCDEGEHEDREDSSYKFWRNGSMHFSCSEGSCSSEHDTEEMCMESLAAAEELDRAIPLLEQRRWAALATLIVESRTAKLNAERQALQFTGCGSKIAAHIPIAGDDAKQLMQEIANALNEE